MAEIARSTRTPIARANHVTARLLSILASFAVDAGLVWLLYFRAPNNPPFGDAETFWMRVLGGFGAYAVLQQWTLANQTGRGVGFAAAIDKYAAASPLMVAAICEAYWLAAGSAQTLSWRHHAFALLWAAFALTDYFATDVTNQRLKACATNAGEVK